VEKGNNNGESRSEKMSYRMVKKYSDMTVIHFTLAASVFKISRK
jgi:hypothetical protein